MTRYVCSHHVGFAFWLGLNIIGVIFLGLTLNEWSQYNFKVIDDNWNNATQSKLHYKTWWDSNNLFLELFSLGGLNTAGMILANWRYHWIELKECKRNE